MPEKLIQKPGPKIIKQSRLQQIELDPAFGFPHANTPRDDPLDQEILIC